MGRADFLQRWSDDRQGSDVKDPEENLGARMLRQAAEMGIQ